MNPELRSISQAAVNRKDRTNPVLKAVLIYPNFAAGERARGFFENLASAWDRILEEEMWNFDALGIRELRNAAASAARYADVVAVSALGLRELPSAVRAWFDLWLWLLEEENPALVALFDSSRASNILPIRDYLSCIARRAGIEFLAACREVASSPAVRLIEEGIWPKSAEQALLSYLKTKDAVRSTLAGRSATRTGAKRRKPVEV